MRSRMSAARVAVIVLLAACGGDDEPDAYGNFETDEVVVSAETRGQLRYFAPSEGIDLAEGQAVAQVDTMQLALERAQIRAQSASARSRVTEVDRQIAALEAQRDVAGRALERTRRLMEQQAATAQQMDQAERDYRTLVAQVEAARAQQQSVMQQGGSSDARVAQIDDLIARSRIVNPVGGVVLATFVNAGEIVQPGQPLYRIASLDTLVLRAYVSAPQLAALRLGQTVSVQVDDASGGLRSVRGTVSWISPRAEFTPTPIQTRDERADLVYAVKIRVPNPDGLLKIGMPADVSLDAESRGSRD